MMQTVRHGHAEAGSRPFPMDRARAHPRRVPRRHANPRDLRRQAITATGQALPTTAALTSRHNRRNTMRRPTTTATAAIRRSRALIILRPHPHTRRRELIRHRAAAIQLRLAPTPHLAAVTAAAVVGVIVAAVAEATAAVEAVEAAG